MKQWFKSILLIAAVLSVVTLGACGKNESQKATESPSEQTVLPTKDPAGKEIKIPQNLTKVISLVPSTTQVIIDLGAKEKLIAVDTQSTKAMPEVSKLPQFDMMSIDTEKLMALKPEVIYINDINKHANETAWKQVRDAGITVIEIPTSNTIKEIAADVQFIADSLSQQNKGKELVTTMNKEINEVRAIGKKIDKQKTVLFEISGLPHIYSFGKDVFLNEMLLALGAKNVLAEQKGWVPITEEAAIAAKPDVILTNVDYEKDPIKAILERKSWQQVPAIKTKSVYQINNLTSSLPNHHITKALKEMAKVIYPNEYKDITV